MNLNEYQKRASEFAVYPRDIAVKYITTKLAGESGELLNLLGKTLRGDFTVAEIGDEIAEELGGILWYVSELYTTFGEQLELPGRVVESKKPDIIFVGRRLFLDAASVLQEDLLSFNGRFPQRWSMYSDYVYSILANIDRIAEHTGMNIEQIAERNIALLEKRRQAGTIQGHNRNDSH